MNERNVRKINRFRRVILAALVASSFAQATAADLLEWSVPKAPPQFRRVLDADAYKRRSAPLDGLLTKAKTLSRTKYPDHGLKIHGILAPTALEASGLTLDDIVMRADGKPLWGRLSDPRRGPTRVQFFSVRSNRVRDVRVAVALQRAFEIVRRPDLVYLRGKDQNPKWDRDVFIGLTTATTDPDLAETAWQRALASGYPRNRASLASGAALAMAQGRPETALDFWYEAEHAAESEPLDPLLAYRVAIANGKWERVKALASEHPEIFGGVAEEAATLIANYRAMPAKAREVPSPTVQVAGMHRHDVRNDLIGADNITENKFLDRVRRQEEFEETVSSGHFRMLDLTHIEGINDFDLKFRFTMVPTDAQRSRFVKLARLMLYGATRVDRDSPPEAMSLGQIELEMPSGFSLGLTGGEELVSLPDPQIHVDGKRPNSVRYVKVGGLLEVFINDRRILYRPVDPTFELHQIRFQSVGMTIEIDEFILAELIPRVEG